MKFPIPAAFVCVLVPLSGCNTPPPRADPFAGITTTGAAAYSNLSIAALPSENTQNSIA